MRLIGKSLPLFFLILFSISCKKEEGLGIKPNLKYTNEVFFNRTSNVLNNYIKTYSNPESSQNLSSNFIDSVLLDLRRRDNIFKFSNFVVNRFGIPLWDFSIQIRNDNLLSTLITPILDTNGVVRNIIISHKDKNNKFYFKIVNQELEQIIPEIGDMHATVFTKNTLNGIFKSFNYFVHNNYLKKTNLEEIKSNSNSYKPNATFISFNCWYYVSYDGKTFTISNTQCAYNIVITNETFTSVNATFEIPGSGDGNNFDLGSGNQYAPADFQIDHYWEHDDYDNNDYINPKENSPIYNSDGYRKNGQLYHYKDGIIQNFTNDKGGKYAIFTKNDGTQIKFEGATITDFGILFNRGATTANGGIHADLTFNLAALQHEYGHYLQANFYGTNFYNNYIMPASLWSMIFFSSTHSSFWTEVQANQLSISYFGPASAISLDPAGYPR